MKGIIILSIVIAFFMIYGILPTLIYRLWNKKLKPREDIYLTFDDGVDSKYTIQLIKLLKKHNVVASFFVVAEFAQNNPEIIKEIKDNGHVIGLHSLRHNNEILQTPYAIKKDFSNSIKILRSLGVEPKFFRPPWGHFSIPAIKEIKKANLKVVLWNVIVGDWKANISSRTIADKLLNQIKKGDIICLHDGRGRNDAPKRTIEALEIVLPIWKSYGYTFKTVEELYEER